LRRRAPRWYVAPSNGASGQVLGGRLWTRCCCHADLERAARSRLPAKRTYFTTRVSLRLPLLLSHVSSLRVSPVCVSLYRLLSSPAVFFRPFRLLHFLYLTVPADACWKANSGVRTNGTRPATSNAFWCGTILPAYKTGGGDSGGCCSCRPLYMAWQRGQFSSRNMAPQHAYLSAACGWHGLVGNDTTDGAWRYSIYPFLTLKRRWFANGHGGLTVGSALLLTRFSHCRCAAAAYSLRVRVLDAAARIW